MWSCTEVGAARVGWRAEADANGNVQFSARRYRSFALIEIAEAIEALLQLLRASSLFLPNSRARDESAPAEVRHAVVAPSRASQIAAKLAVGVCLYHCDPCVDFAACPLAFDVCTRIVPSESEILRARGQSRGESCEGGQSDSTADRRWHVRYSDVARQCARHRESPNASAHVFEVGRSYECP
jgi:hypothetical protein